MTDATNTQPNNSDYSKNLKNKHYDLAKKLVQLWIPGAATLYFTLASLWGLPNPDEVTASAVAIATFLGLVLQVSNQRYQNNPSNYDGVMQVHQNDVGKTTYSMILDSEQIENLASQKAISFKVE